MAFPDVPVGWSGPQDTQYPSGYTDQSASYQSIVGEEHWTRIAQQVDAAVSGQGPPIQIGSHTVGPGATAEQVADATKILAYRSGNPVQNWSTEETLKKLVTGGAKAVAGAFLLATPFIAAAGGAGPAGLIGAGGAGGGAGAAAGGVLDSSGAVIPGTEAVAGAGGNALAGAGAFADKWLPTITGGVNTLLGYNAANRAQDAEIEASNAAIAEQRRQYDADVTRMQPWIDSGTDALGKLNDPAASFEASPGYAWARGEGIRDIGNSFSARGGAQSGNALRALSEFQTGLAQQDFGNWWNQQSQRAGLGQNAVTNVNNIGQNTAGNVSNALLGQGISRASGVYGRNSALAGGLNQGVSNWLYRRRGGG